ncbi:hypothetical protein GCM10010195_01710 [Kitasatospora griseola]|nr:hypothetical protein GCM10010195_01710 [Kitasatospora griseola]
MPSAHLAQLPQPHGPYTATDSPSVKPVTPAPSAAIVPTPSWPRVSGSGNGSRSAGQLITAMSEWQAPAAVTFSRTCPGPGSGSGTVTTSGWPPTVRYWTAFMCSEPSLVRAPSTDGQRAE